MRRPKLVRVSGTPPPVILYMFEKIKILEWLLLEYDVQMISYLEQFPPASILLVRIKDICDFEVTFNLNWKIQLHHPQLQTFSFGFDELAKRNELTTPPNMDQLNINNVYHLGADNNNLLVAVKVKRIECQKVIIEALMFLAFDMIKNLTA